MDRTATVNSSKPTRPTVHFLLRHYVEFLTVLTVLFILQTGLVPFDFSRAATGVGSRVLFSASVTRLTFPDIVSNIFLYVPLGALLHWCLVRNLRRIPLTSVIAIAFAAALSGIVESLQAYSVARVSSVIDLTSNVVGATVGVCLSWTTRRIVPHLLGVTIAELHEHPQAAILKAYCLLLVVFAAIPFSFSFDGIRLKQAVRAANFVPFRAPTYDDAVAGGMLPKTTENTYAYERWLGMKRWSRWAAECASFALLAWLALTVLRNDYGFSRKASVTLVMYLGGAFAIGLTLLQLPIVSRACDVTDIVFRWLGLITGLIARPAYLNRIGSLTASAVEDFHRIIAKIGLVMAAAYILYMGVIPCTFGAQTGTLTASVNNDSFLPFFAYFMARFDLMMADAMQKFASYVVFAALLAMWWSRVGVNTMRSPVFAITVIGVSLSLLIELVQVFIPVRVTSLTDPILAAAGCLTGALAQRHAAEFYHFARTRRPAYQPERARRQRSPFAELPLDDALIATLYDPRPDAPIEPSPARACPPTSPRPERP